MPENSLSPLFLDNPGGTQLPDSVINAMSAYCRTSCANVGGMYATSETTECLITSTRQAIADLFNVPLPHSIIFGPNMTSLTFHVAEALRKTIKPGDEIVVTRLDHDANITPWLSLANEGAVIRWIDIKPHSGTLDIQSIENILSVRTRWVAVTHASNVLGSIPDIALITKLAHSYGAMVYVDATHYVPHGPIDVQELDCDFMVCSMSKAFGPHVGVLYGKLSALEKLSPNKVSSAPDHLPRRWELGTQNYEGIAGLLATIAYLEAIGKQHSPILLAGNPVSRGQMLRNAMSAVRQYEMGLSAELYDGLNTIQDIEIYGTRDCADPRVPTLCFTLANISPCEITRRLSSRSIYACYGNFYATHLLQRLCIDIETGCARIGLVHYNTIDEIYCFVEALSELVRYAMVRKS